MHPLVSRWTDRSSEVRCNCADLCVIIACSRHTIPEQLVASSMQPAKLGRKRKKRPSAREMPSAANRVMSVGTVGAQWLCVVGYKRV